jgi:Trk K+ transport system NAD-binding subunit
VPVLIGDARELSNLQKLEIGRARCLIACTEDDITNLEIALNARAINPDLKIVIHLHDPDLAVRVQHAIGLGVSRSAAGLAAPAFVSAALGHRVVSTLQIGNRSLVVAHAFVAADSGAADKTIGWLLDGPYARVLALHRRPGLVWRPGADFKLEAGDDLVLVTTRKGLDEVLRRTEARPAVGAPASA